jgi:4a-hydroxytetrahydrobiopterin dehydratase
MRSSMVALTRAGQRPAPADEIAPVAAGCAAGGWPICCLTDGGDDRQSSSREGGAMPRLDDTAVAEGLQRLPGWERRGDQIVKTFVCEDFARAMVFVNEVASAAEAAGHHPDIDIRWNKVTLALSSHTEGGLTDRDFQLAARIQELDQPTQPA